MESIKEWLKEHGIEEVEGVVPDMAGVARGKFVPAAKFCQPEGMRLPESVFIQTVTGEYIEQHVVSAADPDMILRPDPSTIRHVPWASEPTASVIHDCFRPDGSRVEVSPRHVLRHILDLYDEQGWRAVMAPEVEFYLVKPNTDADYPLEPPVGRSGRPETAKQPYSIDAVNEFEKLFEDIYDYCEAQRIEADTLIHEAGAAQLEINFLHGDPLDLADQVFHFKRTVREAAMRHGVYATFMAKPMAQQPGSSMHLHQSILDKTSGANVFAGKDGKPTELFYAHIGGLQKYVREAVLVFAPYVNSYRRFARYQSAPINLRWGIDNRTVGLRVPASDPENLRIENRVAGADVNPYLVMAASLACGYLGMIKKLKCDEPIEGSAYESKIAFPRDIFPAVDMLESSEELKRLLGPEFIELYCALKRAEHSTYFEVISPWEREFLLLNV